MTRASRYAGSPGVADKPKQPSLGDALAAAANVVAAVLDGHTPDAALQAVAPPLRPAAMDLAYSTLRAFGKGDFTLQRLLERPLKDHTVRGLLLVALARLEARPDQAHTIVDQAVGASARISGGHFKGLVNGVLRSFERRRDELLQDARANEAARWQHPGWWIARIKHDHPDHWESILTAGNMHPPMGLRLNLRRLGGEGESGEGGGVVADFAGQLVVAGIASRPIEFGASGNTSGALVLERPVPVERLPGFGEGLCSVQDVGAQHAAAWLDCVDGLRVLDACAAPGGKTAHLLERFDLELLALDADATRAARVSANLERLGLAAEVVVEDCRDVHKWWDGRPFDRILADVPCTASGVVRRHPDAKWLRRAGDVAQFARTQAEILDALWKTLAPGGKMLYATCSLFNAENSDQVTAFIARHPDAMTLPLAESGVDHYQQLLPNADHDGFFYALLQRR